jgi:hypothetical protein
MATELKVWTLEEIAKLTRTPVGEVVAEVKAGRLRGFQIGSAWRVTEYSLRAFMEGAPCTATDRLAASAPPNPPMSLLAPWSSRPTFAHTWPDGKTEETYDTAYEADVSLPSGRHHFVIAYANRKAAGMKDRRRVIVFMGHVPRLVPLVEFSGANDYATTQRVASVIKDASNKHVRTTAMLPAEYQGFPTAIYSDVVVGPNAAKSVAVLANSDDRDLMLRHAIIRARQKGLIKG